jgi:hypothetical protein
MGIRILPNTPLARIAIREGLIPSEEDMLQPVYYLSPGVEKKWLEETLTKAFAGIRHCIFPPDALDTSLQLLHKLGYSGPMWDMLLKERTRGRGKHGTN